MLILLPESPYDIPRTGAAIFRSSINQRHTSHVRWTLRRGI